MFLNLGFSFNISIKLLFSLLYKPIFYAILAINKIIIATITIVNIIKSINFIPHFKSIFLCKLPYNQITTKL